MTDIPLGEPGLGLDGAPARAHDQTPRTRRAFSYQDYAAYALLLKSIDGDPYTELWIELHDDILATRKDGRYDLYQVKTRESSDEPWVIGDKTIHEVITRFCAMEAVHGDKVASYFIYSNLRPYIPMPTAAVIRKARSFHALQYELMSKEFSLLPAEYLNALHKLINVTGANSDVLIRVLSKLRFIVGPSLDSFRDDSLMALCTARPKLVNWTITDVQNLELELLHRIEAAGSAKVPPLLLHTSPVSAGGLPYAEIHWRRVSVLTIKRKVMNRIRRRKILRSLVALGGMAVFMVFGGVLFRPLLQVSALQHALDTIQNSQSGVLPSEFNESIAIVRAAREPLRHINFNGANMQCQDLSGLDMLRASGQYMHATGATFDNSILAGALFNQSELNGSKFRHARMDDVFFQKSNMLAANLFAAEARNANFSEATLNGAIFSHGVFTGTDFSGANLELAEMRSADFSNAKLKDAVLTDANVSGSDFTGAKYLTQEMLSSACITDDKPPVVDKSLTPTTRPCYTTPQEQEERKIKRFATFVVGQVGIIQGYCKDFEQKFRPANSKLHPQSNEQIWYDGDELGDAFLH